VRSRILMSAAILFVACSAIAANAEAAPVRYVPKHGTVCKSGYVRTTVVVKEAKVVRHHAKVVRIREAMCVRKERPVSPTTTSTTLSAPAPTTTTVTSTDPTPTGTAAPTTIDLTTATVTNQTLTVTFGATSPDGTPVGGPWSIRFLYTAYHYVLGPWTSVDSAAIQPSDGSITLRWAISSSAEGTVLTFDSTPDAPVSWSGPASVVVPTADVTASDVLVQAGFDSSPGFSGASGRQEHVPL